MRQIIMSIMVLTFLSSSCLTIMPASVQAANDSVNIYTNYNGVTLLNGRWWRSASVMERGNYLFGIHEGKLFITSKYQAVMDEESAKGVNKIIGAIYDTFGPPPDTSTQEISEQITHFYSDSANRRIPIIFIYELSLYKFKGVASHIIEEQLSTYRKEVNSSSDAR